MFSKESVCCESVRLCKLAAHIIAYTSPMCVRARTNTHVHFQKTGKSFNDRPENADQASPSASRRETNSTAEPETKGAQKYLNRFRVSAH